MDPGRIQRKTILVMNKQIENTMFKGRETAAAEPAPMRKIDYEVGDFVQIRANAKNNIGRVGVIIGIRYKEFDKIGPALVYTVKFSDQEAADFITDHFNFIRSAEAGKI